VQVDVHVSNRNVDFAEEHFDLAIRGREPADSRLVARRLEDAELVVVATPAYLARRGTPAAGGSCTARVHSVRTGLMQAYRFTVQDALASGELVEVLAEYGGTSRPFTLIYPQSRHMPQRVRAFIDFLFAEGARSSA